MDRSPRTVSRSGFTLVELLVVIGVIGLLSAILLPITNAAIRSARKATAQRQINDLAGAIKRYFAEYNKMPILTGNGKAGDLAVSTNSAVLFGLLANSDKFADEAALKQGNPRGIIFLSLDRAGEESLEKNGVYADPWGNPYVILLDTDFDDRILQKLAPTMTAKDIRAKVAVYSPGADGTEGTKDDIKTW